MNTQEAFTSLHTPIKTLTHEANYIVSSSQTFDPSSRDEGFLFCFVLFRF